MDNENKPIIVSNIAELSDFLKEILVVKFRINGDDITEGVEYSKIEMDYNKMAKFELEVENRLGIKADIHNIGYIIRTDTFGETVSVMAKKLNLV